MGIEPIYQLTCRDRNSLALQSDLMGAQGLGIPNVLCLTGDPVRAGHFADAKGVFEVESVGLLRLIKNLKEGRDSAGKALESSLQIFQGAVVNPSVASPATQIRRMEKKIEAGAQFFQTQAVFSFSVMEQFMRQIEHLRIPVIAGVLLVRSLKTAQFLHDKVPGVFVPPELFEALAKSDNPSQSGIEYTQSLARSLLSVCQGVHLMAVKNEEALADIVVNGSLR